MGVLVDVIVVVRDRVRVAVLVGVQVAVEDCVRVGEWEGVQVLVGVGLGVDVRVGVEVQLGVGVLVGVRVKDAVGVIEAVRVGVRDAVGVEVRDQVAVGDIVRLKVGVKVPPEQFPALTVVEIQVAASRFGPPSLVNAVKNKVLSPPESVTGTTAVPHVVQAPVAGKANVAAWVTPFTTKDISRDAVPPLA